MSGCWPGFSFFSTRVRCGDRLAKPPIGRRLLPVRNFRKVGLLLGSISEMYLRKCKYYGDFLVYPWSGSMYFCRFSCVQSESLLALPQTICSMSLPSLLAWQNGANDEIGKMELKPFLNAEIWSLTVSWNVECNTRSTKSWALSRVTSLSLPPGMSSMWS